VITPQQRKAMGDAAVTAAKAVGYVNAGTVEFIYSKGEFFFLEMNTRLQVEHPVTELVTGIDLVVQQVRVAAGEKLQFTQDDVQQRGWAIECRINAEDWQHDFRPAPGRVTGYHEPSGPGVRVDSALVGPTTIPPYYDPMIAKLITWGADRTQAIARMRRALLEYGIAGVTTNIAYHLALIDEPDFVDGKLTTHFIPDHPQLVERAEHWEQERAKFAGALRDPARVAAIGAAVAVTL
jgi:pyruvate carboxylase subunit A